MTDCSANSRRPSRLSICTAATCSAIMSCCCWWRPAWRPIPRHRRSRSTHATSTPAQRSRRRARCRGRAPCLRPSPRWHSSMERTVYPASFAPRCGSGQSTCSPRSMGQSAAPGIPGPWRCCASSKHGWNACPERIAPRRLADRFPAFREALLEQCRDDLERVDLAAGEVVLRKGEKAHSLYVVVSGMLRATTVLEDGRELTLSEFGCGDMAGEMAMLAGGGAYSASVSVAADAVLVRVPREALEKISKSAPQAIRDMASGIRRRLARDHLAVGLPTWFAPLD